MERQKAAKEEAAADAPALPDIKDIKIPDLPKVEMPKIEVPKIEVSSVECRDSMSRCIRA